jgi:CRP/FNR family transcriptional regulator, cyclic AMP receptor protein
VDWHLPAAYSLNEEGVPVNGSGGSSCDVDLLAQLAPEDRAALCSRSLQKVYPKGAIITSPGDTGHDVYYVLRGGVKIYNLSACGREITYRLCGPHSFFGIAEIFANEERGVFAEATQPTEILCIDKRDFEQLVHGNPTIALSVIQILGSRIRQAHRAIKGFAFSDARSRMAQLLVKLAQIDGAAQPDGAVTLKNRFTHQELANMIGAIRQTVTEILNDFKRDGYIRSDHGKITIVDFAGLESLITE